MASRTFLQGLRAIVKGDVDFDSVTLKTMLMATVPTTANLYTWAVRSDITGEFSATGYTAGGVAQAYTFNAADTVNFKQTITMAALSGAWPTVTWPTPPVGCIIYADKGSAAADIPLFWVLFSSVVAPGGLDFPVTYASNFEFVL